MQDLLLVRDQPAILRLQDELAASAVLDLHEEGDVARSLIGRRSKGVGCRAGDSPDVGLPVALADSLHANGVVRPLVDPHRSRESLEIGGRLIGSKLEIPLICRYDACAHQQQRQALGEEPHERRTTHAAENSTAGIEIVARASVRRSRC